MMKQEAIKQIMNRLDNLEKQYKRLYNKQDRDMRDQWEMIESQTNQIKN